jgi:hypothetical protein
MLSLYTALYCIVILNQGRIKLHFHSRFLKSSRGGLFPYVLLCYMLIHETDQAFWIIQCVPDI